MLSALSFLAKAKTSARELHEQRDLFALLGGTVCRSHIENEFRMKALLAYNVMMYASPCLEAGASL